MGKWAEVHCNCPNRVPLSGSDYTDMPHRNKRHHRTQKSREEVAERERTLRDMFECGHRSGNVIALCPSDIILLGHALGRLFRDEGDTFEVFTRVGDWHSYEDELLLIQPDEAALWLTEIEEVQKALQSLGNLPYKKIDALRSEWLNYEIGVMGELAARLDKVAEQGHNAGTFPRIVLLKQILESSEWPDAQSILNVLNEALSAAAALCHASRETGNPIRLLW